MSKHEHHPFENQIFHHFREQVKEIDYCIRFIVKHGYVVKDLDDKVKEIDYCIRFIVKHGYVVKDLEDQVIDKWNVDERAKPNISYNRTPKLPRD